MDPRSESGINGFTDQETEKWFIEGAKSLVRSVSTQKENIALLKERNKVLQAIVHDHDAICAEITNLREKNSTLEAEIESYKRKWEEVGLFNGQMRIRRRKCADWEHGKIQYILDPRLGHGTNPCPDAVIIPEPVSLQDIDEAPLEPMSLVGIPPPPLISVETPPPPPPVETPPPPPVETPTVPLECFDPHGETLLPQEETMTTTPLEGAIDPPLGVYDEDLTEEESDSENEQNS